MSNLSSGPTPAPGATATVFRLAMIFTLGAVAMGSLVCATESGMACPTWPGCYVGQIQPHPDVNPVIEFVHRVVSVTTGPLLLASAVLALRRPRAERLVRYLPWLALLGAFAAAVFGRQVVLYGLPPALGVLDLGLSLVAMVAITTAAVALSRTPYAHAPSRVSRLAWSGVGTLIVMHVLGILTAGPGSYTRCMGWPIWRIIDSDQAPALQWVRIGLAVLATGLIVAAAHAAWGRPDLRPVAAALVALWVLELAVGLAMGGQRISMLGAAVYSLTAVAIVFTMGLLAARGSIERVLPPGAAYYDDETESWTVQPVAGRR
ncbi:MAG: hypothetical protein KDB39_12250 [Austwickia sp.]|nr:hypothetical protein [Austwickia sp.]